MMTLTTGLLASLVCSLAAHTVYEYDCKSVYPKHCRNPPNAKSFVKLRRVFSFLLCLRLYLRYLLRYLLGYLGRYLLRRYLLRRYLLRRYLLRWYLLRRYPRLLRDRLWLWHGLIFWPLAAGYGNGPLVKE